MIHPDYEWYNGKVVKRKSKLYKKIHYFLNNHIHKKGQK